VAGAIVGTLGNVDPGDPTGVYTYKIVGGTAASKFVDPNDAAGVTQLRLAAGQSLDYEAGDAQIIVRVTDRTIAASPVTFQQTIGVRPADVNEQPGPISDSNPAANSVAENVAALTGTGVTLLSIDPEGAPLTYTLTSDTLGWFAVNASTGVVTIRSGAAVNYEATASGTASINVQVSDGVTAAVTLSNLVINITDINETPYFTSAASASIAESTGAGAVVATLSAADPDKDTLAHGEAGLVYSIIGGTGTALFEIVAGQIRTKAGAAFNYEATQSYSLTLRVRDTNNTGLYADQNFTVNVTNVNEAPTPITDSNPAANSVTEGATAGAGTGVTMFSTDPEGTAITYSLTSDQYGWFAINATTGVVTVRAGATVNYETTASGTATIGVQASDGVNAVTLSNFAISIGDVNETPAFTSAASASIAETTGAGVAVITLAATDPDKDAFAHGEAGLVYSIIGGTGTGLFEIVSGQVRTKSGATFDYDAGLRSYSLTLRVRDTNNTGLYADQNFTVNITNINEAPTGLTDNNAAANVVGEGATAGAGTGVTLWAADPENGLVYSITNNPFNWFAVNPTTGVVTVRDTVTIDYETTTNGTVAINVQATDNVNPVLTLTSLVISVTDVNETPSFTSAASASLSETAGGGAFVGTLAATDPDRDTFANGEAGFVYSANGTGTGTGLFEVVAGQVRTKSGAAFDFDAGLRTYTLGVRVRDTNNTGLYADQTFTINISDVNEAPGVPAAVADQYVNENAAFSVALSGSADPEGGEVDYEFNLTTGGNPGGLFAIDNAAGSGGTLRLISSVNFETIRTQSYYTAETSNRGYVDVRVLARDPAVNKSADRVVRVHFDNLNDNSPAAPVLSAWGTVTFAENSGAGLVVATFTAPSDGDGTLNALSYQLTSNPGGMFEIVGNQVRVITTAHFNYEAFASGGPSTQLPVAVRTTDGANVSGLFSFNVQVNNVDDLLPVGGGFTMQNGYSTTLTENTVTPVTGLVVSRASASDGDGDLLTYSIVGGNTANTFTIDAGGYISATNGIDYEGMGGAANAGTDGNIVVNLIVRAAQSNNGGRYVDQTLTLNIADVVELTAIYDGSGMANTVATSPVYTTTGFAPGHAGARMWVGGNINSGGGLYWKTVILRDSNGDGQYTLGTDQTLFERNENYGPDFTVTGYRWESTIPASGQIPNGIRFVRDLPPIVLDLNGDGQFMANISVSFDVDGNGMRDRVGWIGAGDAFLVLDRNLNGSIDSGAELSFVGDKPGALTDLEGLTAFDSNQDGRFDALDARFADFAVWQDADQDGVSESGEMKSLAEAGIASLSLAGTPASVAAADSASHALLGTSTFTRTNGQTGQLGDVALRWNEAPAGSSTQAMPLPANSAIAMDRNGNGIIDPLTEVSRTSLALAAFDSNGDDLISPLDTPYYDLRLWTDTNDNDRAEPDEVASLDRVGLTAISTSALPDSVPATLSQVQQPAVVASVAGASALDERRFRAMLDGFGDLHGRQRTDALLEAAMATEAGSPLQSRMVQAMASFGAVGAAETMLRDPASPHVFGLYAAS
jgi:hypothetical protein